MQSPKTQFNNSMAPDLHLSENVETHAVECKNQANFAYEDEGHSGSIQSDPGQLPGDENPEDGQSNLRE